jgi:hypothetical protein
VVDVLHIADQFLDELSVSNVTLDKLVRAIASVGRIPAHLDSVLFNSDIVERVEIIEHDDIVAVADEPFGEVPADKSCAASDEYSH